MKESTRVPPEFHRTIDSNDSSQSMRLDEAKRRSLNRKKKVKCLPNTSPLILSTMTGLL